MSRLLSLAAAAAALSLCLPTFAGPRPVTQLSRQTDDPHSMPSYLSKKIETRVFEGCFIAIDPEEDIAIEVISDDGCDVTIDGVKAINRFRAPQHLPDPSQSVQRIPSSGGVKYGAAIHHIRVDYSNIIFNGQHQDIDGCTLVAPGLRFFQCSGNGSPATGGNPGNGNNGVGNGEDPAPPGNPPENDGAGTSPGNPGNQGGAKK